ncbi:DUF2515 family protein [Cohnella faecalis]|uniref:DUF2515 domain-containing protein n=1 Tax=Cohnella faecalis TaxID=2315694 RepID=A0A398CJ40_9BACL|nr:DUF2515 family protein [Cohnella faecalis]RIE02763.1 DUF2515 domain-containing protein [Cohnella faecalis]
MNEKKRKTDRVNALMRVTGRLAAGMWNGFRGWYDSIRLTRNRSEMRLSHSAMMELREALDGQRSPSDQRRGCDGCLDLVERITSETTALNRNNLTRTQAYWDIYQAHPELHWALLAHLVSRNGGWSMTDLKGQWLPKLLPADQLRWSFDMLESCNSLIFGDAYPQLRLYAESKRQGIGLFRLLPSFGVSVFMQPCWERFWTERNSVLISTALIVNEQHYIQSRVVENEVFRKRVFDNAAFQSQPLLQLNQIVFPLKLGTRSVSLAGRILERFESLEERIEFGKCLYAMLFGYPTVLRGAAAFAKEVAHTGSRADYWPHVFADKQKTGATAGLSKGWYSPCLSAAWPDKPLIAASRGDWYSNREAFAYLEKLPLPRIIAMSREHMHGQRKLQAAALALGGRYPL